MTDDKPICKRCIGEVTNGSIVALVDKLRTCPTCCDEIARTQGAGYRMLCLAFMRFRSTLIMEEWESQTRKAWVKDMETKHAAYGLSLRFSKNEKNNQVITMTWKRPDGQSTMSMEGHYMVELMRRAEKWMRDLTDVWGKLPDKTRTNPTKCIIKPGPDFVDDEPTTGVVRKK